MNALLLATETTGEDVRLDDLRSWFEVLSDSVDELLEGFLQQLPLIVIALVVAVVGIVVVRLTLRLVDKGLTRSRADEAVRNLVTRLGQITLTIAVLLLALSIAGVNVSAVLAGLGIAGLALAFALQNILENFVAGVLILVRRPFRIGDEIVTLDHQGRVQDVNLRVTKLVDPDGESVLIPNTDVFSHSVINLTERGTRRSSVTVGVDYRDDHDEAREVIRAALADVDGVLESPAPDVLMSELGESSVNFTVFYWTLPQQRNVLLVQDRVLSAVKSAIQEAGMTIPWPIRTLEWGRQPIAGRD